VPHEVRVFCAAFGEKRGCRFREPGMGDYISAMSNPLPTIARVVVNLSRDREFDYRIPELLRGQVHAGTRVVVPFGHSERIPEKLITLIREIRGLKISRVFPLFRKSTSR